MQKCRPFLGSLLILLACSLVSCSNDDALEKKGFRVDPETDTQEHENAQGMSADTFVSSQPGKVLLTGIPQYRLTSLFKVSYTKKGEPFIGSNSFLSKYHEFEPESKNDWHNHIIPGFAVTRGYNIINVLVSDTSGNKTHKVFDQQLLIKNIYYPSFLIDTLNGQPVHRNYYFISAFNKDTNKDGFINTKDLRTLYLVSINGQEIQTLVPEGHGVTGSAYDQALDRMYLYLQEDRNKNGERDKLEPIKIYWIDLKNPENGNWLIR